MRKRVRGRAGRRGGSTYDENGAQVKSVDREDRVEVEVDRVLRNEPTCARERRAIMYTHSSRPRCALRACHARAAKRCTWKCSVE